ncbi:MAG TPA: hypothetical protein VE033_16690, partial [Acetobacteraceae bacterium]|nr:hypothetical protein [Acetobacteraceae bacterium]
MTEIVLPALMALAVPLAWAAAFRRLGLPGMAGGALAAGAAAGFVLLLGLSLASPRQLWERLPLLMLLLALPVGGGWVASLGVATASAWWMSGAPRTAADWRDAAPELAGIAGLVLLLRPRLGEPWAAVAGTAALLAGLLAAAPPGPVPVLAAILLAAALGAALGRAPVAATAPAVAMAALGVLPVLARGAPADWAAAAAA